MHKPHRIVKVALALAVVVSALAAMGSSALAAGAPNIVSFNACCEERITSQIVRGQVNPNGAETTYQVEYGIGGTYTLATAPVSIGTGTETIKITPTVAGLKPGTVYNYRLKASNKYGTTYLVSGEPSEPTAKWRGVPWQKTVFPAEYASQGTFAFEFKSLNTTITCEENGVGTIGNTAGEGDSIKSTFTKCSASGSASKCKVKPFSMNLNGRFTPAVGSTLFTIEVENETECGWAPTPVTGSSGFIVTDGVFSPSLSIGLTQTAYFGLNPVYITGSSIWKLLGPYSGNTFGIAW